VTYDAQEQLGYGAKPYELFLFQGTGLSVPLTSADAPISYLGNTYVPASIERAEVDQSSEVTSGTIKIFLPKDHPLAQMFIPYLPVSPISVIVYGSHYTDLDGETVALFTGTVASARFTDQCELTCTSSQYLLQRKIPKQLYQSQCAHVFGDAGCTVNLADHTYDGEVSAIDATGTVLTVPGFASLPDSLTNGYLAFAGNLRMIVAHAGEQVTLLSPIVGLEVGSSVAGTAGCALTFAACAVYKNIANFLGFDLIPEVNPFDGSASVG
jgi:uncharacterized phage protein (TIGR02218 family)